jgi:hypothetical protein
MSTDDDDGLTDDQILDLPMQVMPGDLSRLWSARANIVHEREFKEFILELNGGSNRHLMFPDQDPVVKRQREEEARRRAWLAEQEMQEYRERSDRLLAQIDQQQRVVEKRRKEIEDSALKLHDGRRVYVDGDLYRDEQGRVLEGMDRDEAATLHSTKPDASTWRQKNEIDDRFEELKRMKQKVLDDREQTETGGQDLNAATDRLSADEKEFAGKVEARAQQAPVDYGSADYMAAFGDEYTISTVPAFTKAADGQTVADRKDTDTDNPQTQNALRPLGLSTPKI